MASEQDRSQQWRGQDAKGGRERSLEKPVSTRQDATNWNNIEVCDRDALRKASIMCLNKNGIKEECEAEMEAFKVSVDRSAA